ncbi:LytR/AlgR family response regulator transcription factor [Chitinophaga arvensicola]|uniref:DNA-binding response regulator, LytR/AlgR family n=1 Tax=Chitinophaga arvensicola TaxID=29529 RepID=A0A1I0QE53_9BACT|nr:LytTR family DNA-binding domain-containing protein [Chitinophaga arvensicola]SEW25269.1 DNA-binding response regulator, LytR/AlgR family [Chitinophaga arvensicola]
MINCLIIDDAPIAREIVAAYCSHLPFLHIAGSCGDALEAKSILETIPVQLLFLDINMPVLNGISFLRTLKEVPAVIFTTAYKEYATDAFDLAACDYLVKPFSLERFIVAVDKARQKIQSAGQHIFLKAAGKIYQVQYDDILYAEARGNYTRVVTSQQVIVSNISFSQLEATLPPALFLRVHRSFMIHKNKISHIQGNCIYIGQQDIPIGNHYKDSLFKILGV